MRKLFSVLSSTLQEGLKGGLLFLALIVSTSVIYASNTKVDGIWYDFDSSTKTASVTYRGSAYNSYTGEYSGSVVIPASVTYNGTTYRVTSIGDRAFARCSSLTSVTIGNSVTSIGEDAFEGCSELTSMTIPNSVTSIGRYAFYNCSSLTSITIPNSVTSIGSEAFRDCSALKSIVWNARNYADASPSGTTPFNGITSQIKSFTFGDAVEHIPAYLCDGMDKLTSVTIPNSVTSIGDHAFFFCTSLTSITIPNSVTSIGYWAFGGCSSLTSPVYNAHCFAYMPTSFKGAYTIPDGIKQIAGNAFYECTSLTSITIPNSVTSIGDAAFFWCDSLTSVTIPNSVTSIGEYAFAECYSLTSITIPNSVTSIGEDAFHFCSALTKTNYTGNIASWCNIKFGDPDANPICYSNNLYINDQEIKDLVIPNSVDSIHNYAFYHCSSLTSITIPKSVTSIGDKAFYYCTSLTSITIPESVTSIGDNAFCGCSSLTSVTIPNSVTEIGDGAFYYCYSLSSVTIPESVTSIGEHAFYYCTSLTSITIPNSVTSIGRYAFYYCTSLTSITCEATTPPAIGENAFYGVSSSTPVYVPCGCVKAYKAKSGWKDFTNIQEPLAEYLIEVNVNDNIMGTAKVDRNSACGNQISATPNFGYHFVQWSDGSTDTIRTLELTQDTILTAEFAPNKYTITTVSSDTQRGTTQGDTTVNYLELVTITATSNYGYHFTQWNDGNTENPRLVQVTEDTTYTAAFEKNTYSVSLSCNNELGSVKGTTSAQYLDTVIISATPNFGYHFVQWSDGNTDTIRTLELTQDTILTAEFAQSFSGQCGDNLYWNYDESTKTISITGSGNMYDYSVDTVPWLLFKEQIMEVTTSNTATSIGTSAFEGCVRLGKLSLGAAIENIAATAFAGCNRLYHIYCYPTYPPFADQSSFANYNVYLHVPCDYKEGYDLDIVWGKFNFIECIDSEDATTDGNVTVDPGFNDVTITWPTEDNADNYTIVIEKDGKVFCTLTFNAAGQLLNIAFAPSRDGSSRPVQYAEQAVNGYRFTVTGLDEGSAYIYELVIKDNGDNVLQTYSGEFRTQSIDDRTVTVKYDTMQGEVIGAGTYLLGDTATLTVIPNEGYRFVGWTDGKTDNPRTLVVTQDTTLTVVFEVLTYNVTVTCDPIQGSITGSGTYNHGDGVTLTAIPNEGYQFVRWSNDVVDNPYTFVISEDITLTAEFEEVIYNSVENTTANTSTAQKLLRDGQLLIIRAGKTYDAMGQEL